MKHVLAWLVAGGVLGMLIPVAGALVEAIWSGQPQTVDTDVIMVAAVPVAAVFAAARSIVLAIETLERRRTS